MKRGTPRHPKTADLAGRLSISQGWAVGILESLWHWAGDFCPDGAIRYAAQVVAENCWWPRGDAERLVVALRNAGWLDDFNGGWLIHDWPDHCEDAVHRKLAGDRRLFADGSVPKIHTLNSKDRAGATKYYAALHLAATGEVPRMRRGSSPNEAGINRGMPGEPLPLPLPLPLPEPANQNAGLLAIEEALKGVTGKQPTATEAIELLQLAKPIHKSGEVLACFIARLGQERQRLGNPVRRVSFFRRVIAEDYRDWLKQNPAAVASIEKGVAAQEASP